MDFGREPWCRRTSPSGAVGRTGSPSRSARPRSPLPGSTDPPRHVADLRVQAPFAQRRRHRFGNAARQPGEGLRAGWSRRAFGADRRDPLRGQSRRPRRCSRELRLADHPQGLRRRPLPAGRGSGGRGDAVLLIVAVLDDEHLRAFQAEAWNLDLDCLIEVHDEPELDRALEAEAEVIGINNRNLDTGFVDVNTTYELITDVPAGKTVVSESGISTREELVELERVGVDAALIGESLMRSPDPAAKVAELAGTGDATSEHFLP
ncbi:MAG: hypothetical protein IPK93_07955 [Solirubrobacterales bacterium]|nr:hypothetical protein [Solirubrobacterales bacterium]